MKILSKVKQLFRRYAYIYFAPFQDVWDGLFDPWVYEKATLWDRKRHDPDKITRVIESWIKGDNLSPIFLVKHGSKSLALLGDGNHRLTVARAINYQGNMPFMVQSGKSEWCMMPYPQRQRYYQFHNMS